MKNNDFCINALDVGSIWGKQVDWIELNKIARSCGGFVSKLQYCGNYVDCQTDKVYAVFYTEQTNYFVLLDNMTRFQKEITGLLGVYWQQRAEKELKVAIESAAKDATVDKNGAISWKSNGNYLMDDFCEKLEFAGFPFSREATKAAREAQVAKELDEYRKKYRAPSAAEMDEMRNIFGEGATVVDVLAGIKINL